MYKSAVDLKQRGHNAVGEVKVGEAVVGEAVIVGRHIGIAFDGYSAWFDPRLWFR